MAFLKHLLEFTLGFIAVLGILFLVATSYGWDRLWDKAIGPADTTTATFEGLSKGPKPNQALICPNDLCANDDRDQVSPVYNLTATDLRGKFVASLEKEERLQQIDDKSNPLKMRFVQNTKTLRFPDIIDVQLFELEGEQSTLALYSRSRVGHSDFGVNIQRLNRWLARLSEFEAEKLSQSDIIKPAE